MRLDPTGFKVSAIITEKVHLPIKSDISAFLQWNP